MELGKLRVWFSLLAWRVDWKTFPNADGSWREAVCVCSDGAGGIWTEMKWCRRCEYDRVVEIWLAIEREIALGNGTLLQGPWEYQVCETETTSGREVGTEAT
jgi:hypothetical protein